MAKNGKLAAIAVKDLEVVYVTFWLAVNMSRDIFTPRFIITIVVEAGAAIANIISPHRERG